MRAERQVQPSFRIRVFFQALTLAAAVLLFDAWQDRRPDSAELGPRASSLRFTPVGLNTEGFGPLRVAGAWSVTSNDRRFGGISALAIAGGEFVALSDAGAVIRFTKPVGSEARAIISELPDGPGRRGFKFNRDSEAFAADPRGRGWWVAFENRNELWLYDRGFSRVLGRMKLGRSRFPENRGIEGATTAGDTLIFAPEDGRSLVEWRGGEMRELPIANPAGRISDLVRLPSGQMLALNRRAGLLGFVTSIGVLERGPRGYGYGARMPLAFGRLDNVEAVAAERLPDDTVRLWLMSDDNHQHPLRTLLVAVDLPAG